MLPNYAVALEKLAWKNSFNNEVFECVKKPLDETLQDSRFIESHERNNFMNKDNTIKSYKNIETSIDKLRIKFKSFKEKWSKIQSRIKNGSGLAPENEPHWWKNLNCVFSKTNEVINLTSSTGQTSFVRNEDDDNQEVISNDGGQESDVEVGEEKIQDSEDATTLDTGESVKKQINKKLLQLLTKRGSK